MPGQDFMADSYLGLASKTSTGLLAPLPGLLSLCLFPPQIMEVDMYINKYNTMMEAHIKCRGDIRIEESGGFRRDSVKPNALKFTFNEILK